MRLLELRLPRPISIGGRVYDSGINHDKFVLDLEDEVITIIDRATGQVRCAHWAGASWIPMLAADRTEHGPPEEPPPGTSWVPRESVEHGPPEEPAPVAGRRGRRRRAS